MYDKGDPEILLCLTALNEARIDNTQMWRDFTSEHNMARMDRDSLGIACWVGGWWKFKDREDIDKGIDDEKPSIKKAKEKRKNKVCRDGTHRQSIVYVACEDCGKERWVQAIHGIARAHRCRSCENKRRVIIKTSLTCNG